MKGGSATSIFTGNPIPGDYIKAMAQQGQLGTALLAVEYKVPGGGRGFRLPSEDDIARFENAKTTLTQLLPSWQARDIIPSEEIGLSNYDRGHRMYGMQRWVDLFNPRQLLAMGVLAEELQALQPDILAEEGDDVGSAVAHLLAFAIDKFANHNTQMSRFENTRGAIKGIFDRHNYEMKWTYAEMNAAGAKSGVAWAIDNVISAYEDIAKLPRSPASEPVEIIQGSATNLLTIDDKSITAVVTDPPYDDNVQYSELADFFYVWLKRTQGHRRPEWFSTYLTDRTEEAIVNKKFHERPGQRTKEAEQLARAFYRDLMLQSFREAHRVLRDDGVLTVMFTHKKQEAWEALFGSLIEAGFTITATWPIKTESEHSLHQAKQNAAQSTVILVARKRPEGAGVGFYGDDMRAEIQERARQSAERLEASGLNGVDQLVGSFGPAMEVYSRYDSVRLDTGKEIGVGQAIDDAAEAVSQWRVDRLSGHGLDTIDAEGRFALLCWDVLGAAQFRFNEAKLLGNAVGMDVAQLEAAGLVSKAADKVTMLPASARRRDKSLEPDEIETLFGPMPSGKRVKKKDVLKIHPNDPAFRTPLDAAHALALRYVEAGMGDGGIGSAKGLALQQGWSKDSTVAQLIEALVQAAPQAVRIGTTEMGKKYPEFRAWHALLNPLFGITAPDWTPVAVAQDNQPKLFGDADEADAEDVDGEEDGDGEE